MGILSNVDEELIPVLPQFFENLAADMEELKQKLEEQDGDAVESIIHKIKGYAGSWGFPDMHEIAVEFEKNVKARNWASVDSNMETLEKKIEEIEKAAEQELNDQ